MLGFIDDGQFIVFTELFPDAKIYLKIDKTITTAFIESETLNEEEIETINKELNRLISNPHKYQKIGDNTWRVEDYDGQTIEESLLGNYLCILFGSDYLGFATR
jgi:hypothetical protein